MSITPEIHIPETLRSTLEWRRWPTAETSRPPWSKVNFIGTASHPAGAKTILTLFDALDESGPGRWLLTTGGGTKIAEFFNYRSKPEVVINQPANTLPLSNKDSNVIIFSGTYGEEDMKVEVGAVTSAIEAGAVTVGIEDDAQGLLPILTALAKSNPEITHSVKLLLLSTRSSAKTYSHLGLPPEILIPTGQPAYDFVRTENTSAINLAVRNQLIITPDDTVIFYHAARSWQFDQTEVQSTRIVVAAIKELADRNPSKKFVVIYRLHPAEFKDPDGNPEILLGLIPNSKGNIRVIPYQEHQTIPTDTLTAAANLNISNLSTTLSPIALRGARTGAEYFATGCMPLYFLFPPARKILETLGYDLPVPARLGAAAIANDEHELIEVMEKALFKNDFRQEIFRNQAGILRKEYRLKGTTTATDRARLRLRTML